MITEILIRTYTPEYRKLLPVFSYIIEKNTNLKVSIVDHCNISINDFKYYDGEHLISIDRHIAKQLDIPYFRISRVFDVLGNPIDRYIAGTSIQKGNNVRVLDSDIVNGGTAQFAKDFFQTTKFDAPLHIKPYQDLIDIEDIMENNTIIKIDNTIDFNDIFYSQYSYLYSKEFFEKRTSLPKELYELFKNVKNNFYEHKDERIKAGFIYD